MNWYCVHTKPKRESRVAACLAGTMGCETYLLERNVQLNINRWQLSKAI